MVRNTTAELEITDEDREIEDGLLRIMGQNHKIFQSGMAQLDPQPRNLELSDIARDALEVAEALINHNLQQTSPMSHDHTPDFTLREQQTEFNRLRNALLTAQDQRTYR
jgi:hypothetical protein